MTLTDERPRNGHANGVEAPTGVFGRLRAKTPAPGKEETAAALAAPRPQSTLLNGWPATGELADVVEAAKETLPHQNAPELLQVKTLAEIKREQKAEAEYRGKQHELRQLRQDAEIKRERMTLAAELAELEANQRDIVDAGSARAQLDRLANPISYLATQVRHRKVVLSLTVIPAAFAVLIGAVQAQDGWRRVLHLNAAAPVFWVLFTLEALATLPVISILIFQSGESGKRQDASLTDNDEYVDSGDVWLPDHVANETPTTWKSVRSQRFFGASVTLLTASVLINVGPHVLLGEISSAWMWLWIPATIVLTLHLLPKLANGYALRILMAKQDAVLNAPVGPLPPTQAKAIRLAREVDRVQQNGEIVGEVDEFGIPGTRATMRAIKKVHGRAGVPDARAAAAVLRVWRGVE